MKKRSLTGIKPSGDVHIGNYLGMIRPALELQESYHCMYFIADLHALTTLRDAEELKRLTYDNVAIWLALGLDIKNHVLWRQSDVPLVTELTWYLNCVTGVGLHQKAHAFKDAVAKGKDANMGLFNYPALMAADILIVDPDIVPVGKDQKQHVEFARDMAGSFNSFYGEEIFKLPEPIIREEVMVVPGTDGQKMSKSYGNVIPLFGPEKTLRKQVLSITTDSSGLEDPKELDGTLLGQYFSYFTRPSEYGDLKTRLAAGGLGWGHAKQELFEHINSLLSEPREEYERLRKDEAYLESVLQDGAKQAYEISVSVLNRARNAVGVRDYPYSML